MSAFGISHHSVSYAIGDSPLLAPASPRPSTRVPALFTSLRLPPYQPPTLRIISCILPTPSCALHAAYLLAINLPLATG